MKEFEIGPYQVFLNIETQHIFNQHRQVKPKQLESGGILLGQVKDKRIYILRASTPSPFDKATRYSFRRNPKIAQVIINYELWNSGQLNTYLGEWHTHPEKSPSPSKTDDDMIKDQLIKNQLHYPFVLQYIQGTKDFFLRIITKLSTYETTGKIE